MIKVLLSKIIKIISKTLFALKIHSRIVNQLNKLRSESHKNEDHSNFVSELLGEKKLVSLDVGAQGGFFNESIFPKKYDPFFDPIIEQWVLQSTPGLQLHVKPNEKINISSTGLSKEEISLMGKDIRFLNESKPNWRKQNRGFFFSRTEITSYHSYEGNKKDNRIALIYNLMTNNLKGVCEVENINYYKVITREFLNPYLYRFFKFVL